jgi:hypothetical protein
MRAAASLLAVALLGAAASPEPAATTGGDRFPGLLGTWTCRDGVNALSTLTFSRDGDSIAGTERKPQPDGSTSVTIQRFRFDPVKARWQIDDRTLSYAAFSGSAPPWTGTEWNVAGIATITYPGTSGATRTPRAFRYVRAGEGTLYRGVPDDASSARVNGEVCAPGSAPPDAGLCAAGRVSAVALHAAEPVVPPERGNVQVHVQLDADSRIVATRIAASTNPLLNASAMRAARASTFRTEYRDCRPVPSDYLFSMEAV